MVRVLSNSSDPARRRGAVRGFVQIAGQARRRIRTLGKNDPNSQIGDRELMLAESVYATLTTAMAGADNDLTFTAKLRREFGNAIRVAFVNPGGTAARSIVVAGNDITVNLAVTAGAINATETATNIAAAINADPAASQLVSAAVAAGNSGAGVVTAMALTNLAGGLIRFSDQEGTKQPASSVGAVSGRQEQTITPSGSGLRRIRDRGVNRSLKKR